MNQRAFTYGPTLGESPRPGHAEVADYSGPARRHTMARRVLPPRPSICGPSTGIRWPLSPPWCSACGAPVPQARRRCRNWSSSHWNTLCWRSRSPHRVCSPSLPRMWIIGHPVNLGLPPQPTTAATVPALMLQSPLEAWTGSCGKPPPQRCIKAGIVHQLWYTQRS
jgi:hypothetical protein